MELHYCSQHGQPATQPNQVASGTGSNPVPRPQIFFNQLGQKCVACREVCPQEVPKPLSPAVRQVLGLPAIIPGPAIFTYGHCTGSHYETTVYAQQTSITHNLHCVPQTQAPPPVPYQQFNPYAAVPQRVLYGSQAHFAYNSPAPYNARQQSDNQLGGEAMRPSTAHAISSNSNKNGQPEGFQRTRRRGKGRGKGKRTTGV